MKKYEKVSLAGWGDSVSNTIPLIPTNSATQIYRNEEMSQLKKIIYSSVSMGLLWLLFGYIFHDRATESNQLIDAYIERISIEDAVGQLLMVGLTADINTVSGSKSINDEIVNVGIGSAIVTNKNYFDDNKLPDGDFLQKIVNFNNSIQDKTLQSKLKLPLIIAADFEGYGYAPIRRALLPAPSALSLGATRDGGAIEKIGGYVGIELESIGIHAMLGPVLDAYNLNQGDPTILQDRSFAGTTTGVAITASHYVKGLKRANILLIGKHFPSHGSVKSNPHSMQIPTYQASSDQIERDLLPFIFLSKNMNGIMTSHIKVEQVDNQIATFSKRIVNQFSSKKELENLLVITDDLSEMGAMRKYMYENTKSYSDIAIEAFDAGHDILLFAHCNEKADKGLSINSKGQFTIDELKKVKEGLIQHIKGFESRELQLKKSLKKIFKLKESIAYKKDKKWTFEQLTNPYVKEAAFLTNISGRSVMNSVGKKFQESFGLPVEDEPSIEVGEGLVRDALRHAATMVHNKNNVRMLNDHESSEKIVFAVYDEGYEYFIKSFMPKFANAKFFKIPREKKGPDFKAFENSLRSQLGKFDLLIYTARDRSDSDLLNRVRKSHSQFSSKSIVLCHNNPGILDNALLNDTTTIVLYTNHPIAFEVATEILSGQAIPKGIKDAPVNIGENGDFYSVTHTNWIESAGLDEVPDLNSILSERESRRRLEMKYVLVEKSWELLFRWFVVTSTIIFAIYLLHLVGKYPSITHPGLKVFSDKKIFFISIVIVLMMSIYFSLFGSGRIHELLSDGKVISSEAREIKTNFQ